MHLVDAVTKIVIIVISFAFYLKKKSQPLNPPILYSFRGEKPVNISYFLHLQKKCQKSPSEKTGRDVTVCSLHILPFRLKPLNFPGRGRHI